MVCNSTFRAYRFYPDGGNRLLGETKQREHIEKGLNFSNEAYSTTRMDSSSVICIDIMSQLDLSLDPGTTFFLP